MDAKIAAALVELNQRFYETTASSFAATRRRVQPGILRLLPDLPDPPGKTWADLGCGPGALAREWLRQGRTSRYLGLDFSQNLLEEARQMVADLLPGAPNDAVRFVQANLAGRFADVLQGEPLCGVLCFATLHHLPSHELRLGLVRQAAELLPPGGWMVVSVWQFQHAPRLMERVQPWQAAGLRSEDVDAGDYLLDWRAEPGAPGALRYVHLFSEETLATLARQVGLAAQRSFLSDGQGGRLGLYSVWQKPL